MCWSCMTSPSAASFVAMRTCPTARGAEDSTAAMAPYVVTLPSGTLHRSCAESGRHSERWFTVARDLSFSALVRDAHCKACVQAARHADPRKLAHAVQSVSRPGFRCSLIAASMHQDMALLLRLLQLSAASKGRRCSSRRRVCSRRPWTSGRASSPPAAPWWQVLRDPASITLSCSS